MAAMASPSRWALRPVTAAAGSTAYLLAATSQSTVIGRACADDTAVSAPAAESSGTGKIGLLAPGSAGISRTHAALQVSAESLTIAGRGTNLISVVRAGGGSDSEPVRSGEPPVQLEHNDLVQLDGFRDDPRFVFRVEKIATAAVADHSASPPDDAPTEAPPSRDEIRAEVLAEVTAQHEMSCGRQLKVERDSVAGLEKDKAALVEEKLACAQQLAAAKQAAAKLEASLTEQTQHLKTERDSVARLEKEKTSLLQEKEALEQQLASALQARTQQQAKETPARPPPAAAAAAAAAASIDLTGDDSDGEPAAAAASSQRKRKAPIASSAPPPAKRVASGSSAVAAPGGGAGGIFCSVMNTAAELRRKIAGNLRTTQPAAATAAPCMAAAAQPRRKIVSRNYSTGGNAPRKHLAMKAARKSAPFSANAVPLPLPEEDKEDEEEEEACGLCASNRKSETCASCEQIVCADCIAETCDEHGGFCDECVDTISFCSNCGLCSVCNDENPSGCCKQRRMGRC
eukprot:COSAG06_NODE_1664_length_8767_cov_14.628749_2_plen_515_part_00